MTGDLLIATPVPMDQVEVGDVLSLRNDVTDKLVTHRVIEMTEQADGSWHVRMQGDANDSPDSGVYVVTDDTVLAPRWQLSGAGTALMRLTDPGTAVPLLVAVAAILALSLMRSRSDSRSDAAPAIAPDDDAQGNHETQAQRELAGTSAR
jgi:signal peptidase